MKNKEIVLAWNRLSMPAESNKNIQQRLARSLAALAPEMVNENRLFPEQEGNPVRETLPPTKVIALKQPGWRKYLSVVALVLLVAGFSLPLYKLWKSSGGLQPQDHKPLTLLAPSGEESDRDKTKAAGREEIKTEARTGAEEDADEAKREVQEAEDSVKEALAAARSRDNKEEAEKGVAVVRYPEDEKHNDRAEAGLLDFTGADPEPDWQPAEDLPQVPLIYPRGFHSLGAGELSGLLYRDADEFNQFNALELAGVPSHLPVFENPYYLKRSNHFSQNKGASEERLKVMVEEIAKKHGILLSEFYFLPTSEDAALGGFPLNEEGTDYVKTEVFARGSSFDIHLKVGVSYTIYFKKPFALPENSYLHLVDSSAYNPYGDGKADLVHSYEEQKEHIRVALEAVLDEYADLLPLNYLIVGGLDDYDIYGRRLAHTPHLIVPQGKTSSEQIVSASFNSIQFLSGIEASLWDYYGYAIDNMPKNDSCYGIIFSYEDTSRVFGDYPIISPEEAEELLFAGKAFPQYTPESVLLEKLEKGKLVRLDLIYRRFEGVPYFIPYYVFALEEKFPAGDNPDVDPTLNIYQPLYVPAIDPDYLLLADGQY